MPQHVTESIWHFIGYMHMEELLSSSPLRYSGAGVYGPKAIDPWRMSPTLDEPIAAFDDGGVDPRPLEVDPPAAPALHLAFSPVAVAAARLSPLEPLEAANLPAPVPPGAALDLSIVLTGASEAEGRHDTDTDTDTGTGGASPVIEPVSAIYTVGGSQLGDLHITQANSLLDVDILRADPAVLIEAGLVPAMLGDGASPALAELVQQAIDALPSDLVPALPETGIERTNVAQDGEWAAEPPEENGVVAENVEAGRWVDGERTGDGGTATAVMDEAVAHIGEAVEAAAPIERSVAETHTSPDGNLHIVTGPAPTGGAAHDAITGGNNLVNAAVLYDLSHAASSIIVRGDVRETNAIVQVNVLQDKDTIDFSGGTLLETAITASAANAVHNAATFVEEEGSIYGNVMLGGVPGATSWQIDYVEGNFYDLTTLHQVNFLVDRDISEQTTTSTRFIATLGDNGAINLVQLDVATTYDLIIIGGDYNELNAIVQVNVLLDDDAIRQIAQGSGSGQWADGGGNALGNEAAIVEIGGESYRPLDGDAARLADAIGGMEAEFEPQLASGLPWNGSDTLRVLYVTDDYYNTNVLCQTNVLDDSDHVTQAVPAGGEAGEDQGSGAPAQTAAAGGNTLDNSGLIVGVGSTSDYQYVGGTVYEDTLLVQANIVTDGSEEAEGDLHPDVVATIAALSGAPAETAATAADAPDHTDTSNGADVIGGILS